MKPDEFKRLSMAEQQEALDAMPEVERKTILMLTRSTRQPPVVKKPTNITAQAVAVLIQVAGVAVLFLLPWFVGVPLGVIALASGAVLYRRAS